MSQKFKLSSLDHVALTVSNIDQSINWYESRLGMIRREYTEWRGTPIFVVKGNFGIALFPADGTKEKESPVRIDHFAFRVTWDDFVKAQSYLEAINEPFRFEDHIYFQSIYLTDPDGHCVELTVEMEL